MSRSLRSSAANRRPRARACTSESMPLATDPQILNAVQEVYTTDLALPEDWTEPQRAAFIAEEAEVITWMVCAEAGTIGDRNVDEWARRNGHAPDDALRATLMAKARQLAYESVLDRQLYEQITALP